MFHIGAQYLGLLLLAVTFAHSTLTLLAVAVFKLRRARSSASVRPVSVLKPLCGIEANLEDNLRSFCEQKYPEYELIFGVRDPEDPALTIVTQLRSQYPKRNIRVVVNQLPRGANRKVSNLASMVHEASHELLVIADSDTRASAGLLRAVTAQLSDPQVGLVTCTCRSVAVRGLWSRLGAMYINDWYMPSVMLAWLFGHRGYVSGQAIAMRRTTLEAIGGFDRFRDHLADDYELGRSVREIGLKVALSPHVPETMHSEPTFREGVAHEVRWMRTVRTLAPRSFQFLCVSFGFPMLLLGLAFLGWRQPTSATTVLVGGFVGARLAMAILVRAGHPFYLRELFLLPVRDFVLLWVWSCALFTSRVRWRGHAFEVDSGGLMRAAP